jgi:hypothetical protein
MKTLKTIQRAAIAFAATTLGIACAYQQTADQNGVYKVGGELTPPAVIAKSDPEYTEEARKAGIDGTVLLAVVVGTDWLTTLTYSKASAAVWTKRPWKPCRPGAFGPEPKTAKQ